jgi:signal transduction histidine kinase
LQGSTLAEALGRLADRFTAETGTPVRIEIPDSAGSTTGDAAADVVLLRAAQEALSNVRRHAAARAVVVRLGPDGRPAAPGQPPALRLEVVDDGRGVADDRPVGLGLSGMHERVAAAGGTLDVGPGDDGGTRVSVRLPARSTP